MGESIVVRLLSRIGAALAALMFASAVFAQTPPLTAPVYKTPAGYPAAALGIICLNLDGTNCTFGGGGGTLSVNASANPTVITAGSGRSLNEGLFSNLFVTLVNNADGTLPDFSANGSGIGPVGSAPPTNAVYLGGEASGVTAPLIVCDKHAPYDASDNGSKTIVAGVPSKKIYVCGFMLATGGTATNLSLSSGTGADCVTTSVNITPAYQLAANDRVGANAAFWNGLITLANADNLCVKASAGNAHQAEVWYTVQP